MTARPGGAYGYGFNVGPDPHGHASVSHSGAFLLGAHTAFILWPQAGLGITVLTNAQPRGLAEAIALAFGALPPIMNGLTQQVKAFERLTIEAAVHGCRDSALLALVSNPLVGNVTDARALLDEVLTINRPWLTQFN